MSLNPVPVADMIDVLISLKKSDVDLGLKTPEFSSARVTRLKTGYR